MTCPVCSAPKSTAVTACPRCGHSGASVASIAPVSLVKNGAFRQRVPVSLDKAVVVPPTAKPATGQVPLSKTGPGAPPSSSAATPPPPFQPVGPVPTGTWGASRAPAPSPAPAHGTPPAFHPAPDRDSGPALPPGPGIPVPPAGRRGVSAKALIGLGALLAVVALVLAAVLLTAGHDSSNKPIAASSDVVSVPPPATTAAASPAGSSGTFQTSPTPSDPVSAARPAVPSTESHINLTRVAGSAHVTEVAKLLDTYFAGINAHDVDRAVSVFAANGTVNPNDPRQVAAFGRGVSTSRDDNIVVLSISPASFGGESGLAVRTSFRSRQAASFGPENQTCTNWFLTEKLVAVGSEYQLLGSQDVSHSSC